METTIGKIICDWMAGFCKKFAKLLLKYCTYKTLKTEFSPSKYYLGPGRLKKKNHSIFFKIKYVITKYFFGKQFNRCKGQLFGLLDQGVVRIPVNTLRTNILNYIRTYIGLIDKGFYIKSGQPP